MKSLDHGIFNVEETSLAKKIFSFYCFDAVEQGSLKKKYSFIYFLNGVTHDLSFRPAPN